MQLDDLINSVNSLKTTIAAKEAYIATLTQAATTATSFSVFCIDSWSTVDTQAFIKLHQDSLTAMQAKLQTLVTLQTTLQNSLDEALGLSVTQNTDTTTPPPATTAGDSSEATGSNSTTSSNSTTTS